MRSITNTTTTITVNYFLVLGPETHSLSRR